MIERVSAAAGVDVSAEVGAQQCEVTDAVEDLVSSALVGEQQLVVDRTGRSKDEQVLVRESLAETLALECCDFAVEHERAAAGDLGGKGFRLQLEGAGLGPDG